MSWKTKDRQDALRREIRRIEGADGRDRACLPLGIPEIDGALPGGGLRRGCVHEVGGDAATTGFCAAVLARAGASGGSLLWLAADEGPYAPGLVRYGIAPGRLVVVSGLRRPGDVAWALEEALRCPAVRGVVAECTPLGTAASRRLMLAAEGSDVVGLALAPKTGNGAAAVPTAASRWRIVSVAEAEFGVEADSQPGPGHGRRPRTAQDPAHGAGRVSPGAVQGRGRNPVRPNAGPTTWRVELLHCRGGRPFKRIVTDSRRYLTENLSESALLDRF